MSFSLEELGVKHISNRDVILRNISDNQNIESLHSLAAISEPSKMYSRNKGGTGYKSFSPFTLFADACSVNAPDALRFKNLVSSYIKNPSANDKELIINFLGKWMLNFESFKTLKLNSILKELNSPYESLYVVAKYLKKGLLNKPNNEGEFLRFDENIKTLKTPFVDVEIVIVKQFEQLKNFIISKEK